VITVSRERVHALNATLLGNPLTQYTNRSPDELQLTGLSFVYFSDNFIDLFILKLNAAAHRREDLP